MITGTNESKILTKDISCKCNVNLMEENVIQIKSGKTINVNASIKNIIKTLYIVKLETNDKLKQNDINSCVCFYFNDIIEIEDDIDDIF